MTAAGAGVDRLVATRSPFAGFGRRLADGWAFVRAGGRPPESGRQLAYVFAPRRYFRKSEPAADVFYLFRDTPERRETLRRLRAGEAGGLAAGQLFGFDALRAKGVAVDCNLRLPRIGSVRETVAGWIEKAYAPRTGIGLGDVCSVRAHLWQMNRARVVVATTDNTGLPAARLKARGRLRVPLVYVSVGLPERIESAAAKSPARAARYRKRLASVDRFLAYGYAEAEWLRQWLGNPEKVRFLPFGVDTEKWRPEDGVQETTDVLSVGSDPKRDFGLLVEYARQRPGVGVC
nr:glycosyltransferase [Kiritimatiellia bacterium]